jgi:hypothetical protein
MVVAPPTNQERTMRHPHALSAIAVATILAACGSARTAAPVIDPGDHGHYAPTIDPAQFVATIDNPYLPWAVGDRWTYADVRDGQTGRIDVVVTDQRRVILGVPTVVVHDTLTIGGATAEDTFDYYAQDRDGNVWYFGEDTRTFQHGVATSDEGSWEAGIGGAQPGIAMPAHPTVDHRYRQEFAKGAAEDAAQVRAVGRTETLAVGHYADVVVTREWSALEPKVIEEKAYAPGIGQLWARSVAGEHETETLTSFTPRR